VDDIEIQARETTGAGDARAIDWIFDDLTPSKRWMRACGIGSYILPRPESTWHCDDVGRPQKVFRRNPPYGAIFELLLKEAVPPEAPKKTKRKDKKTRPKRSRRQRPRATQRKEKAK